MTATRVGSRRSPEGLRAEVRYRLLGSVSAKIDGAPIRLGGPKQRTVLAALLLNANRVVSEEKLIDLLWGDEPPTSARGQLQVRIWELRKLLGRSSIVRRSPGYLIEVGADELDLHVFVDTVAEGRAELSAGRNHDGARRLREALELWHGPPLGGVTDVLAEREGPMLEERRLAALEELFEAELAAGPDAELIGELRQTVDEHPFRERLLAHLMVALHRGGRACEALEVYAEARRKFVAELGIEPGRALRDLHLRILKGQDSSEDPASDGEESVQPADERMRPAELPCDIRGFAGRVRTLELLDAQLSASLSSGDPATDVWVVSGSAGVGKTALAVHWARRVREHFPDGQLHVNLRGFDADHEPITPMAALAQLLQALGVDPPRIPTDVDAQAGLYRSVLADRRVLLVLDDARASEQVLPLLPPAGTVLVTSRHRLGDLVAYTGARSLPLSVLSAEDSRAVLAGLLGVEKVATEPEATDELARLCGHLPLALRIAAANIGAHPAPRIGDLAAEMARSGALAVLTVDGAEVSAVTRAFELSYDALPDELRRLFRLLGLVPGPDFTPHTAAALVGASVGAATRHLNQLAAAHLVEQHVRGRFRFHDLLREYALDRASADESTTSRGQAWSRLVEFSRQSCGEGRAGAGEPRLDARSAEVRTGQSNGDQSRVEHRKSPETLSRQFHPLAVLPSQSPGRKGGDAVHRPAPGQAPRRTKC